MVQEYKVINTATGSRVYFFKHSLKTASWHANAYIIRNTGKFPMELYELSNKPRPFDKWEFMRSIN